MSETAHQHRPALQQRRAAVLPSPPAVTTDLIALQGMVGNHTVSRMVQRLVYQSDAAVPTLFGTRAWAATQVELETYGEDTIQNHSAVANAKRELLSGINATLETNAQELTIADTPEDMGLNLDVTNKSERKSRSHLWKALRSPVTLLKFASGDVVTPFKLTQNTRMILGPKYLVPGKNDLKVDPIQSFVCSLIAIIKSEGLDAVIAWLTKQGPQYRPQPATRSHALTKMHKYYWVDHQIMYDDDTTHPKLFSQWGYSLIYSGLTSWSGLLTRRDILKPGGKYIFDIDGHTVYTTVRRELQPLQQGETLSTYFSPQSDGDNWDKTELETMQIKVHAIYAK